MTARLTPSGVWLVINLQSEALLLALHITFLKTVIAERGSILVYKLTASMKVVSLVLIDFADLANAGDEVIAQRMIFYRRTTKGLLPKNLRSDACIVERKPNRIVIHLLLTDQGQSPPREVAQVHFEPPPDVSQRPILA